MINFNISDAKPEVIMEFVSIVASVVSIFVAARIGRKQMYVDLVAKKRLESVNERRKTLKKIYLYTNPKYIAGIDNPEEYIKELLELQSALEYRFMEQLHPEKDILKEIRELVELLVNMVKQGYNKDNSEWFTKHDKYGKYDKKRKICLGALKIYNFASWKFVQEQSMGRKVDSIKAFNRNYKKTLRKLKRERKKRNNSFWEDTKKLFQESTENVKKNWIERIKQKIKGISKGEAKWKIKL